MDYKEFGELLDKPIADEHNFTTMFANLSRFTYELYVENQDLKYRISKLEDMWGDE
jgi:hypothetical protein